MKATKSFGVGSALLILAMTGCAETVDPDDPSSDPSATAPEGSDHYPVTVENCGRTLTFDQAPQRAVLAYQNAAEIFVGLGLEDHAVGQVELTVPALPEQADAMEQIPDVSDTIYPPPKEQLLALQPDFLLAYGDFDYGGEHAGAEGLATLEDLETAGTQVYSLLCPDPDYLGEDFEAVFRTIRDLGTIFDAEEQAENAIADMETQMAAVEEAVADQPLVKVLYSWGGEGPIDSRGSGGIVNEVITAAGGENVFGDEYDLPYIQVSLEEVADTGTEAYVVITNSSQGDTSDHIDFLYDSFPNLPASRDQRTFETDDLTLGSAGWRDAQTVEDLARFLHPDAFPQ